MLYLYNVRQQVYWPCIERFKRKATRPKKRRSSGGESICHQASAAGGRTASIGLMILNQISSCNCKQIKRSIFLKSGSAFQAFVIIHYHINHITIPYFSSSSSSPSSYHFLPFPIPYPHHLCSDVHRF